MEKATHEAAFRDYYLSNKGRLFRSFEIRIGDHRYHYDIYWGDPNIVFSPQVRKDTFPLAVTTIPRRMGYPDPRIFLHDMLNEKHGAVFETVVAHEIGHLWLHDVVGINHPRTASRMEETEAEHWADHFSYCFFRKYRDLTAPEGFAGLLIDAAELQARFYGIDQKEAESLGLKERPKDFVKFEKLLAVQLDSQDPMCVQMRSAAETTLCALGDVFN